MKSPRLRVLALSLFAPLALSACVSTPEFPDAVAPARPVQVGIIAINDFHGALEPPRQSAFVPDGKGGSVQIPAGGAAWLASAVDDIRGKYRHSLTVSAGDLTSASQLASSLFLDEPTIGVMNRIALDYNAVGNHEFDRGWRELQRLQNGGCDKLAKRAPCAVEPSFGGANFRYLAANVLQEDGSTLFPATSMREFGEGAARVSVGVIGLTLKGTDNLVAPDGIRGLSFTDEAEAINRATGQLKRDGADAVIVLIHQGARTSGTPNPNGCDNLDGEILPILSQLDPRVDVVVSGHTHWSYVCDYGTIDPQRPLLLTSAGVYGELVTDITLTIDPEQGAVIGKQARNVVVQSLPYTSSVGPVGKSDLAPRFEPRADIAAYVGRYADAAKEFTLRPAGRLAGPAEKGAGGDGGPLGNLIADAQLAATRVAGAQIAFMNPFGIRAPLVPAAGGLLTFGDLYKVQPFDNTLITQTMTGSEIKAMLEQGFDEESPTQFLSPSAGFTYRVDMTRPVGSRIVGMELNGTPLDQSVSYRVTTNSFLAGGGDSFSLFRTQRDAVIGTSDIDALESWLSGESPRTVPSERRASE